MQAKSKRPYPVTAFNGKEFVSYEYRAVPEGCEDEAKRLVDDGILEVVDFAVPPGTPDDAIQVIGDLLLSEPSLSVDLDDLTIIQLKDKARELGITGFSTMNKAELIDALKDD